MASEKHLRSHQHVCICIHVKKHNFMDQPLNLLHSSVSKDIYWGAWKASWQVVNSSPVCLLFMDTPSSSWWHQGRGCAASRYFCLSYRLMTYANVRSYMHAGTILYFFAGNRTNCHTAHRLETHKYISECKHRHWLHKQRSFFASILQSWSWGFSRRRTQLAAW